MPYRSNPKAGVRGGDDDDDLSHTANVIVVSDEFDDGSPTGLYDVAGHPIWRFRDPIGFRLNNK